MNRGQSYKKRRIMSGENTIVVNDGKTVNIVSVSKSTTISAHISQSDTTRLSEEKINFSLDDLSSLPPLDSQYALSDIIGEGGQGVIHIASDKFLQRTVAVKSLKPEFLDDEQVIKNFVTEAKITSQLEHPAIIPLHAVNSGGDEKGLHIAMKVIRGRNLREILDETILKCKESGRTGNIPKMTSDFLKKLIEDFVKVCDAVAFAHNKGVMHRDLKPANIMIGEFHEVYVMDWGIAKLYDDNTEEKTENGTKEKPLIAGTPGFIAPEVVVGGTHTPASDQYALGIILFEIATMSPAISGNSIKEIFEKTRDGKLEPLRHRFSQCVISKDLKAIVRKATSDNPANRYATVSDLASDLRRFLADDELEARPDNFSRKISRWLVNHRNLAATLILSFLLICATIAIFALVKRNQAIRETKRRSLALAALQATVESRAHVIDKHYFHIAHLLDRFSWEARECLSRKDHFSPPLFIDYKRFNPGKANTHTSLKEAPAYGVPISLSHGSLKAPPDAKISEIQRKKYSRALSPLIPLAFRLLTFSDPANFPENKKEAETHARKVGYPVAWMYVGLENGLMFNYPGHARFPLSYDPRKRLWYKNATATKRMVWSAPYKDAFGRGLVVTASKAIRKENGYIYGVAGLDMTFDYITKVLMRTKKANKSWNIGRYLLDKNGKVLIYSSSKTLKSPSVDAEIKFPAFPYLKIYSYLGKNDSGQFEVDENDRTYLVVYAPVETMGWHFVEVVDLNGYLDSRRFLKKTSK